jgi:hypothetical protein
MINYSKPDLTQHPPRSPHVRLGGFVHLPRLLDKARAHLAGTLGDYHYNCPLDQRFFAFTGLDPDALLAEVAKGGSDTALLQWVLDHAPTKPGPSAIAAWSAWLEQHGPGGADGHEWCASVIRQAGPERDDIRSFFDILDLDDYASYGGRG